MSRELVTEQRGIDSPFLLDASHRLIDIDMIGFDLIIEIFLLAAKRSK